MSPGAGIDARMRTEVTRQPTRTYLFGNPSSGQILSASLSSREVPFGVHPTDTSHMHSFTGRGRPGQGASSVNDRSSICNVSHELHSSACIISTCISAVISLCQCNFLVCSSVRITGFPCSSCRVRAAHCSLPLGSWAAVPCPGIFKSLEAWKPTTRSTKYLSMEPQSLAGHVAQGFLHLPAHH